MSVWGRGWRAAFTQNVTETGFFVTGNVNVSLLSFWDTILAVFVSRFDNNSKFVILEHVLGQNRVPNREQEGD